MKFITSWERQGMIKGALASKREILLALLSEKFGSVPETTNQWVQSIESKEELDRLLRQLIHANSLTEMGLDGAKA
jgi:vacuolar-type H+-ATPase subunit E/Vma4